MNYELATWGQTRLDIPSGDSNEVVRHVSRIVRDSHELHDRGVLFSSPARFPYTGATTHYNDGGNLVDAVHYPGAYHTIVTTENPAGMPITWLALRAYHEVSRKENPLEFASGPIGLLAVSTDTQGLFEAIRKQRKVSPDILAGITIRTINPFSELPNAAEDPSGASRIQAHVVGASMPALTGRLVAASEQLLPGGLGPLDPRNELVEQIGWREDTILEDAWGIAMEQQEPLLAAQLLMRQFVEAV